MENTNAKVNKEKANKYKNIINSLSGINGVRYIGLVYTNQKQETSRYVVNFGVSVEECKKRDFKKLQNTNPKTLGSEYPKIGAEVFNVALDELLASSKQNLSEKKEDRTTQSQSQTDAFITIFNGIRLKNGGKNDGKLQVFGLRQSKKVLVEGEPYKPVNSSTKTIAKNVIRKNLTKYVSMYMDEIDSIRVNGDVLEFEAK